MFKRHFINKVLYNSLNNKLDVYGYVNKLYKFPQSFAGDVTRKNNRNIMDKTIEEIVEMQELYGQNTTNYFHNLEIIKRLKQENNETVTLFDKNIAKFQDLPKIRQGNFWQKWYDIELKKNEKNKDDVQFKQNVIYDICKTLIKLELPKSMVKNFTDGINIKEFGKGRH